MIAGLDIRDEQFFFDDGIEPEQWAASLQTRWNTPEQRFLFAFLLDTYRVLFVRRAVSHDRPSEVAARHDAIVWIRDVRVDDSPYGFSFAQVCDELGLPVKYLRHKFLRWYEQREVRRDIRHSHVHYNNYVVAEKRTRKRSAA